MELSVSWPGVSEPGLVHISKLQSHLKHKLQFNMKKKKEFLGLSHKRHKSQGPPCIPQRLCVHYASGAAAETL